MRKIIVSHALLKKTLDKFEDKVIQLEEDALDFLDTPHTSENAKDQLAMVRTEGKKALSLYKVCRKYKDVCSEQYKKAAGELCSQAKDLRKDIRTIETKLTSDYEQRWKEEEKKENDRDMSPVYKLGFVFGLPVIALTIYEKIPEIKGSVKLICASGLFGIGIAYNKNIRKVFSNASKAINDNFTVYYIKQAARECKNKILPPQRNPQQQATPKDKLSLK